MHTPENIINLLTKYLEDTATSGEKDQLFDLIRQDPDDARWSAALQQIGLQQPNDQFYDKHKWQGMIEAILVAHEQSAGTSSLTLHSQPPVARHTYFLRTAWLRYAAVLLLIAGTATFLYLNNKPPKEITKNKSVEEPSGIQPGGDKAILTLADGSTIVLDSAATGTLAQQGATRVLKLNTGSLAYQEGVANGEVLYNTITTPKGGQYQITLPDGSKVWLNAASSIRFPTIFVKERKVTITGELYFEVSANAKKPFLVEANGSEIEVLGTSFNVMSYDNEESVNTTLVDGAVKVSDGKSEVVIQPGEQAKAGGNRKEIKVVKANIKETLAWKNGEFMFRRSPIEYIMRQIERWYDVKVEYTQIMPNVQLSGKVPRTENVSELLRIFEATKVVQFRIENKKIIVSPFKK